MMMMMMMMLDFDSKLQACHHLNEKYFLIKF